MAGENDAHYMEMALDQARKAADAGEVPVGAVMVCPGAGHVVLAGNSVIALCDPTAHAEILALREAGRVSGNYRLTDWVLYCTMEPCLMCMGAAIHARVGRVVFGAPDLRWGAAGSLYSFASDARLNHRIEVVSGVLGERCRALIQNFFQEKREQGERRG